MRFSSCSAVSAHHLVSVYDTTSGSVFVARTGPHAHGHKDYVDTGHRGRRAGPSTSTFCGRAVPADDDLIAWCDCGPRVLSRRDVNDHLLLGHRTVRLP